MESLKLVNSWMSRGGISGAKLPVKISGLMLEGAHFDGNRLTSTSQNSPSVTSRPPAPWPGSLNQNQVLTGRVRSSNSPLPHQSEGENSYSFEPTDRRVGFKQVASSRSSSFPQQSILVDPLTSNFQEIGIQ